MPARKPVVPLTPEQQELAMSCYRLAWRESMRAKILHGFDVESDGVGIAMLALTRAAGKYDPARGVKFGTYATWAIRNEFVKEVMHRACACRYGRTDRIYDEHGEPLAIAGREQSAEDTLTRMELTEKLRECLERLPEIERTIVLRRASGDSLRDLAAEIGATRQRVHQLELVGIARLAQMMGRPERMLAIARDRRRKDQLAQQRRKERKRQKQKVA